MHNLIRKNNKFIRRIILETDLCISPEVKNTRTCDLKGVSNLLKFTIIKFVLDYNTKFVLYKSKSKTVNTVRKFLAQFHKKV